MYQNKLEDFTFGIIRQITFGELDGSGSSYQTFHYSFAICSIIWILVVSGIVEDFSLFIYHTLLAVSAIIGDFSLLVNIVVHFTFHCIIAILLFTFVGYIRHPCIGALNFSSMFSSVSKLSFATFFCTPNLHLYS